VVRLLNQRRRSALLALLTLGGAFCALSAGCNPAPRHAAKEQTPETKLGEYKYAANKLLESGSSFDIRWKVTYPTAQDSFNPDTNLSDRNLTFERCTHCHECGFENAFDKARYGTVDWKPRIKGDDWATPLDRMSVKENAFLSEPMIVNRIYTFLRDETTGKYDVAKDDKGAHVVDLPPGQEAPLGAEAPSK
jgi:hypothetical protein